MMKQIRVHLGTVIGTLLLLVAVFVIHRELKRYPPAEILTWIRAIPQSRLAFSFLSMAFCYFLLTFYDRIAFEFIQKPLGFARLTFASFLAHAFGNNIGLANLAGGAIRFRLYSHWGYTPADIARVVAFQVSSTWVGFAWVTGLVFAIDPPLLPPILHLPFETARPLGAILLGLVALFSYLCQTQRDPIRIRGLEIFLPHGRLFLEQLLISGLDWALTGIVLYWLLPHPSGLNYANFLGVYLLSQMVGQISHVPGGLGVFEGLMVLLLAPYLASSEILGALVLFRLIYYLIPLGVAMLLLLGFELRTKRLNAP